MTGVLALHTATDLCEIAFGTAESVRTIRADGPRAHSERLVPMILDITGGEMDVVRGIAIAGGPGSFTGLRIGLSTAKGVAFGRDLPVFAVSTLAALAFEAGGRYGHDTVVAIMRARRDELYAGIYRTVDDSVEVVAPDTVVTDAALGSWIDEHAGSASNVLIAGPDADRISRGIELSLRSEDVAPSAESVLRLSARQPDEYIVHELSSFEPYYCKEFVAKKPRQSIFDRLPF